MMTNQKTQLTAVINNLPEGVRHWLDNKDGYELVLDVEGQFHTVTFDGTYFSMTHVKERLATPEDVAEMVEALIAERDFEVAFTLNSYRTAKANGFNKMVRQSEFM